MDLYHNLGLIQSYRGRLPEKHTVVILGHERFHDLTLGIRCSAGPSS